MRLIAALIVFTLIFLSSPARADELAELFGRGPIVSDAEMSPNGKLFAFTRHQDGEKLIVVMSLEEGVKRVLNATKDKLHGYYFLDNEHLIITKSVTTRFTGYRGEYEVSVSFASNIRTGNTVRLLLGTKDLAWPQTNLSRIVGPSPEPGHILMMTRFDDPNHGRINLVRVDLRNGKAHILRKGNPNTIDWFVDDQEVIHAREDFSNDANKHVIRVLDGDDWKDLFKDKTDIIDIGFLALSEDTKSLVAVEELPDGVSDGLFEVSLEDASWSEPKFVREGVSIRGVLTSRGKAYGVIYDGLKPSYAFYDPALTEKFDILLKNFPDKAIHILSVTQDRSQFMLRFSGPKEAGRIYIFKPAELNIDPLVDFYENLPVEKLASAAFHTVTARDGLEISTKVTLPPGVTDPKSLPAVVYPHGGPASLTKVGFDDFAQYFANNGYVVIQPNFRGSSGLGMTFERAGDGKWGKEMQDDVTDALQHFVEIGLVDPDRVCIVGHSYGGYSALAGGAYTPNRYKCVIAAGAVADLPKMLSDESRSYGRNHWVVAYWKRVIGDNKQKREALKDVSPARSAENFKAPVLLIHGDDDTVVPISQSKKMKNALQKAGKEVKFVRMKHADHWLSNEDNRVAVMAEMGAFLKEHLRE